MRCYCYVQLIRISCRDMSITLPLVSRGRELNMKSDTFFVQYFHISIFQWLWYGGTIIYWGDWAVPGRLLQVSQYGSNWAKRSYFSNQGFATRTGPCPAVRLRIFIDVIPSYLDGGFFWLGLWSGKRSDEATWSEPVRGRDTGHGQPGESGQWTWWMWGRYLTGLRDPV